MEQMEQFACSPWYPYATLLGCMGKKDATMFILSHKGRPGCCVNFNTAPDVAYLLYVLLAVCYGCCCCCCGCCCRCRCCCCCQSLSLSLLLLLLLSLSWSLLLLLLLLSSLLLLLLLRLLLPLLLRTHVALVMRHVFISSRLDLH